MNATSILTKLRTEFPGKKIIRLPEENPTEILCETEPTEEHPEYSIAISVLGRSVPHKHKTLTEIYTVIKGTVALHVDNQTINLKAGDSYTIKPGSVHWAEADEAWINVDSRPGWLADNHILIDIHTGKESVR